ncbi:hypothetical protein [Paractinoplanes toevensis]|uniref:Uncharacterized protein n=1 Tax=Paractinoplanes toevensis TaxID=571911 RepID=A0A920BQB5_9ACTN|nr:hypothetical protein [Actinoplanes toevensis]GIM97048.1 hypothetical protein Ato02nite_088410 [Actinoplanes toevensis]
MDGELRHFGDGRVSAVLTRIIEALPDCPAVVFSRFGEVLLRTGPAMSLPGELGRYRQVLADPVSGQVLVIFVAVG